MFKDLTQISLLHFRSGMGLHKEQGFLVGKKKHTMLLLRFKEQPLIFGDQKKKNDCPQIEKKGLIT